MNDEITCVWHEKRFDDGRVAQVVDLTFGRARIILFRGRELVLLDGW